VTQRIEIVEGALFADVYTHDIATQRGGIPCWSYVSDGLLAHQQAEIVFTLRRDPGEAEDGFPADPLHLLATIYQLAENGQRVTSGSITEFGARSFFGHHLLYVKAQPLASVTLPPRCLAALLVTTDELRAVREFGSTRVLARLGQASLHYPFPPWADRRRAGLSLARTFETSLLAKLARASAHDAHVAVRDNHITLSVLRSEQQSWQARLAEIPETVPLALLTAFDPAADGCLTWVPGQKSPEAIVPPGSRGEQVSGCFIAFVAEQPGNRGQILEDGFAIELTSDTWQALRRALADGADLAIPATGDGMSFTLAWRDELYVSPIDAQAYRAEGGWGAYQPSTAAAASPSPSKVKLAQVRLLTSQDDITARTQVEALASFLREIQGVAERLLGNRDEEFEILLRVACKPEGHDVNLSGRGEAPSDVMQGFFEAVKQLPPLPVTDGDVSFEVAMTVSSAPLPPES
jgi:hypothetical protein